MGALHLMPHSDKLRSILLQHLPSGKTWLTVIIFVPFSWFFSLIFLFESRIADAFIAYPISLRPENENVERVLQCELSFISHPGMDWPRCRLLDRI